MSVATPTTTTAAPRACYGCRGKAVPGLKYCARCLPYYAKMIRAWLTPVAHSRRGQQTDEYSPGYVETPEW